ncbi:MAG: hypothetical protein HUJ65_00670 [Oscillospiraceae bacterium]|nr:hypothetical protein [Oscillospiraceae bacterium]
MKIKSIPKIVELLKEKDPDTAVNENMLYRLIGAGKIPFDMHGRRMVADLDTVVFSLCCMLDMSECSSLPKIRSIHDAAELLKVEQPDIGLGEVHLRELIRLGRLKSIEVGNRRYIALQSFAPPYCYRLSDSVVAPPRRKPPYRHDSTEQFNELMAKNQHLKMLSKG